MSSGQVELRGPDALAVQRVRTAYQQVADQLLESIISGSLKPGDRLPSESDLTTLFGVSRGTVREALRVLASRDLIHTTRGTTGGTFVSTIERDKISVYLETSIGLMTGAQAVDVADMLQARELLEVPAAGLAAKHRTDQHLAAMSEAIESEMLRRGRSGKFREHRNFHGVVVQATGNELLSVMTEPVFRLLQTRFLDPNVSPEFWQQVDDDHRDIFAAIGDGDADRARTAMHEHLERLRPAYHD